MTPLFVDTNCILFKQYHCFIWEYWNTKKIFGVEYFEYLWQTSSPFSINLYERPFNSPFLRVQGSESLQYFFLPTIVIVYIVSESICVAQNVWIFLHWFQYGKVWVGSGKKHRWHRKLPLLKVLKVKVWFKCYALIPLETYWDLLASHSTSEQYFWTPPEPKWTLSTVMRTGIIRLSQSKTASQMYASGSKYLSRPLLEIWNHYLFIVLKLLDSFLLQSCIVMWMASSHLSLLVPSVCSSSLLLIIMWLLRESVIMSCSHTAGLALCATVCYRIESLHSFNMNTPPKLFCEHSCGR